MSEKDNGGNAFPYSALTPDGPQIYGDCKGMTLRDYFAAHAPGVGDRSVWAQGESMIDIEAIKAYRWADAMLRARSQC